MAKYLLAYRGGAMAETEAEQQAVMTAWMNWFGELGTAVVDGGAPFGPSKKVASDGAVRDGGDAALTGYSIVDASSLDAATTMAKGCPVLSSGGTIDVYEAMPIG
jgi:hypothetical protein